MITINEIRDIKEYLQKDYHANRVEIQRKMQNFYDDKFAVPMIKQPQYLSRTGTAAWLVDAPASHIITRNPQVFIDPKKNTESNRKSAEKVNALMNHWVRYVLKQSPQPFREFVKNLLVRGEAWINPAVNEAWAEDENRVDKHLPVQFFTPDPLNVFGSPTESHGIPDYVMVIQSVSPRLIQANYKDWQPKSDSKLVEWFSYFDNEVRYFEADGIPVTDGIEDNVLKVTPFIHAYSGFGKESYDGRPESLAVGRLNKVTDLLIQECAINSDIDSTIHKFAKPRLDLTVPDTAEFDDTKIKENYDMGAAAFNVLALPQGSVLKEGERILPTPEAFQHFANIRARIAMEAPPIMSGLPGGTSGRQEDIVGYHFIRRFDCIVEATEDAFGKAFDMGREMLKKVPTFLPISQWVEVEGKGVQIDEEDLDNCNDCQLKLKAADPIEDDRRLMAGKALIDTGRIDWETFLIEYVGYTPEKAQEIKTKTIAEKIIMSSPELIGIISRKALEKLGMAEELNALNEQEAKQKQMATDMQQVAGAGPRGGEPRNFNMQSENPEARQMMDMVLSQRGVRSPAGARNGEGISVNG